MVFLSVCVQLVGPLLEKRYENVIRQEVAGVNEKLSTTHE